MVIKIETLKLESDGNKVTYHEITDQVRKIVKSSGVKE